MKNLLLCLLLCLPLTAKNVYETLPDQSDLTIFSPSLATRKAAKLRLANGLEAYLISDPGVEQSAAALAVEAGSWNDPEEYPGMAHFLEHMLFMGTAAYPKEREHMQYIGDYGGKVNAYTASDRTVYMFSVNNEGFEGALDRFSHFFIDPLFLPSCIDRELHAVDQEHSKNIENDGWRQYMIFKETGNPNHPNAKFSTGNADTLRGIPQNAMKAWYKDHYHADKMHLIVLSALPLDQLIELTVSDFSKVPNVSIPKEEEIYGRMTTQKQCGHMIYIKPVKDLKILSLSWELDPAFAEDQEAHVGQLLTYTLKRGSKDSLLALLKNKHLAEAIEVSQEGLSKKNQIFNLDIELSEKGLKNLDEVITYCFEAISRLKKTGIPSYIFDEVQNISNIEYTYQSRTDAFEFVMENAHKLVDEEIVTYPQKTLIPSKYDPSYIASYLEQLTPQNCIFYVLADPEKTHVAPTHEEKWMGAEYAIKSIDQKKLQLWENASLNPEINLPPPNPYIPRHLHLVHENTSDQSPIPTLLVDDSHAKIYFSSDEQYLTPQVAHLFRIKSPLLDGSAKSKAFSDLYLKAISDALFPITSAAKAAGAKINISQENLFLAVSTYGYSDGASLLTQQVFQGIKNIHPTRDQFKLYQQSIAAAYENGSKELPFIQSLELLGSIVTNTAPTNKEKLQALQKITYEQFLDFCQNLFKKTYIEGLIYGNLTQESGEKTWAAIKTDFASSPYPFEQQHKRQILLLSEGNGPFMVMQPTAMQGNAAILMIEEGPYSFRTRGAQQILGKVLKDDFFDTLRTKQQTAYIAKAWESEEEKQLLQFFAVQSSTHKPSELIARFELFLENFVKQFTTKLSEERFENIRKMTISTLEMPPENLLLMGLRLFTLAFDFEGDFNLFDKRVAAIKELTYQEMREMAIDFLSRGNSRRIAILTEGMTPKERSFSYEPVSIEQLRHQGTFVAWK